MTSRAAKLRRLATAETRAFTLLELFIVVAIIILLAGLLLPALFRAKAQAQSAACKNHLRQIGLGMHMYISDSGHYPAEWGRGAGGSAGQRRGKPKSAPASQAATSVAA